MFSKLLYVCIILKQWWFMLNQISFLLDKRVIALLAILYCNHLCIRVGDKVTLRKIEIFHFYMFKLPFMCFLSVPDFTIYLTALARMLTSSSPEVESFASRSSFASRTSFASRSSSRTHFQVLGLGLEASSPRKLPCPRLEDRTISCTVEILLENAKNLAENLRRPFWFSAIGDRLKNFTIFINGQLGKQICYR